jgi:hypothetical protein
MLLLSLLRLLAAGITSLAIPGVSAQEECWSGTQMTCRNAFADKDLAHIAITKACEAMPSCTPGTTPSPSTVTGTYTSHFLWPPQNSC